jgi:GMP reductase
MNRRFDFDDITLIPRYSYTESRNNCYTDIKFGKHKFKLPIIPANMESIIDEKLATELAQKGYFYILHRFGFNVKNFIKSMKDMNLVTSISVGVNEDSYTLIEDLISDNLVPDYITIDIAHGHCVKMKKMVEFIKKTIPDVFLIGGNVCTPYAVTDLEEWGCDAVKCGIGGGSVCTTYHSTGFGNRGWQASMIKECSDVAKKPIIADGSIKEHCDIVKSLSLGASMVMIGGMLSGYDESPGKLTQKDNVWYKTFWGSASSEQKGNTRRVEGIKKLIPLKKESIFVKYKQIQDSLQSAISYAGANPPTLECLKFVDYAIKG